ncbi:MAG: hypothetical protein LUG18_01210 [Candidatus Azobacteroides sp.]|nr:hypothetical protein [Candidatus Azobacteroides sp.]
MSAGIDKKGKSRFLIFLGIGILVGIILILLIVLSGKNKHNTYIDNGLISGEQLVELQNENLRKQIISYGDPVLIDTLNVTYLIPVIPRTLTNAEASTEIQREEYPVEESSGYSSSIRKGYDKSYVDYTNILIYSPLQNEIEKLFRQRALIIGYKTWFIEKDILILFDVIRNDDNKDNRIDRKDFRSLYIYSLQTKEMRMVEEKNTTVLNYDFLPFSSDLWVRIGIDRNEDGKYDPSSEPAEIRRYNFKEKTLEKIVPESMHAEMQRLVEGR